MRRSTTTLRKSGAISRTWMPAPRNGDQRLMIARMLRGPLTSFQKYCCTCISVALDQHGAALPSADAERRDAAAPAGALEDLQHVQHEARARGADGMADRDRAAVDVELAAVELAERAVEPEVRAAIVLALPRRETGEHLPREGLVDLHRIDVAPGEAVALHERRDRMHGAEAHFRRIERSPMGIDDAPQRFQSVLAH